MSETHQNTLFERTSFETHQDGQINILGSRLSAVLDMYGVNLNKYDTEDLKIEPTLEVTDGARVILIGANKRILYDGETDNELTYRVELTATEAGVTIPIFTFDGDTAVLYGASATSQQLDIAQMRELNDLVSALAVKCKSDYEEKARADLAEAKKMVETATKEKADKRYERRLLFVKIRNRVGATLGAAALFAGAFGGVRIIADYDPDQAFDDKGYTLAGGAVAGASMTVEPEFSYQLIGSQELNINNVPQDDVIAPDDGLREMVFHEAGSTSPRRCYSTLIKGDIPDGAVVRAWTDNRYNGQSRSNELSVRFQPGSGEIIGCWTGIAVERSSKSTQYPRIIFQYVPSPADTKTDASK